MIAFLKGILNSRQEGNCVVDVGGVGYEVNLPLSDAEHLPSPGEAVTLYTWYLGREDGVQLFGFLNWEKRMLFKLLLSISGIGPKSALSILSGLSQAELAQAVARHDVHGLSQLPGIGRKTAERLLLELKDKLKIPVIEAGPGGLSEKGDYAEALEALVTLGYPVAQARSALQKVQYQIQESAEPGKDRVPELIRMALRHL